MMEWKPVLLPVFLAAGLVITGLSTPASADQGRGGWGRNDQPRGDIKPRRFEQDAARRAMLDGQVMPFSIIKRRVERERSEEHKSELQSLMRISYAVFCLKKKLQLTTK